MARDFTAVVSEVLSTYRLDEDKRTLAEGWLNDVKQVIHGKHDWYWTKDRQVVQTVVEKTAGTVSVAAAGTTVTGSSTAFASSDVGSFMRFADSDDWYKISSVSSTTSLELEIGYNGTSALSAGTYIIRKVFYSLPNAEKILGAKQAQTRRDLTCMNDREFDVYRAFSDDTGPANLFCVYGMDSSNNLQFNILPHADSAYNLEIKFKKKAVADTLDEIPEKWREVYLDGTKVRALEYLSIGNNELRNSTMLRDKKGDYERGLAAMIADAEPESAYHPQIRNPDVQQCFPGNHLPTSMSIPQD